MFHLVAKTVPYILNLFIVREYELRRIIVDNENLLVTLFLNSPPNKVRIYGDLVKMPTIRVTIAPNWSGVKTIGEAADFFTVADSAKAGLTERAFTIAEELFLSGIYAGYK